MYTPAWRRMARAALPVLLVLCLVAPTEAGGSKSDYQRARQIADRVRDKVLNERLREVWVDAHTLVYRQARASGWQFMRVDARTGKRAVAFDHSALAKALGGTIDAARLPIRPVALDGDDLLVQHGGKVWRIGKRIAEAKLSDVPAMGLAPDGARRSRGGGHDSGLQFVNQTDQAIDLIWLDHSGKERKYATLAPGATHDQHTFRGHVWLVRAADGSEWGSYTARGAPRVVIVTGPPPEEPKKSKEEPERRASDSLDGRYRAFIRGHNVFVRTFASGKERQLSQDGTQENGYRARWSWSPNGRYLVAVQEKPAQTRRIGVVNSVPKDQFQPRMRTFSYRKPAIRSPNLVRASST